MCRVATRSSLRVATASAGQLLNRLITLDDICFSYGCIKGVNPLRRYVRKLRVLTCRGRRWEARQRNHCFHATIQDRFQRVRERVLLAMPVKCSTVRRVPCRSGNAVQWILTDLEKPMELDRRSREFNNASEDTYKPSPYVRIFEKLWKINAAISHANR